MSQAQQRLLLVHRGDREIAIVERTPIWQSELEELLSRAPAQGFSPDQKKQALDSLIDGNFLRTIPGVHPCDGFFAAVLKKL